MAVQPTQAAAPNAATLAQGAPKAPSSAGDKVVVANKLPMALRIHNDRMVSIMEQRPNSPSQEVKRAERLPNTYVALGNAQLRGAGRGPISDGRRILYGYCFTEGIPRDAYENWEEANQDQPFIRNKLVFAARNMAEAEAIARENEKRVTNLEPLNPDGDPRMPRGLATATKD
jgi:hypothetical protein